MSVRYQRSSDDWCVPADGWLEAASRLALSPHAPQVPDIGIWGSSSAILYHGAGKVVDKGPKQKRNDQGKNQSAPGADCSWKFNKKLHMDLDTAARRMFQMGNDAGKARVQIPGLEVAWT